MSADRQMVEAVAGQVSTHSQLPLPGPRCTPLACPDDGGAVSAQGSGDSKLKVVLAQMQMLSPMAHRPRSAPDDNPDQPAASKGNGGIKQTLAGCFRANTATSTAR
jgi:hypothetical protein